MQILLAPSELAYLFHVLEAQRVVGVDNALLFPADPPARAMLLEQGFQALVEHGWFVPEDGGITANSQLMLTVAVVVEPTCTITATHVMSRDVRPSITYYLKQDLIVEQFMTPDGSYVLTRLDTPAALVERIDETFSALLSDASHSTSFTVAADVFEGAIASAKDDAPVVAVGTPAYADRDQIELLAGLELIGHIEGATIAGQTIQRWDELAIMRDARDARWVVDRDEQEQTIAFMPATASHLRTSVEQLLAALTNDEMRDSPVRLSS